MSETTLLQDICMVLVMVILASGSGMLLVWLSSHHMRLLSAYCEARAAGLDAQRATMKDTKQEALARLGMPTPEVAPTHEPMLKLRSRSLLLGGREKP